MRRPGLAAPGTVTIAILLLVGLLGAAPAAARQDASPAAGTPAPAPTSVVVQVAAPAATPAAPAAAAATPVPANATTDVVTLVLWYANSANADIIELYPLTTDAAFVAQPAARTTPVGTVDFPVEGAPTVVIGDTTFESYPRADGSIERWTWFDDFEGARPATLVMQLSGLDGKYKDYYGTGTFLSRDEGGAGGVLILALRPPNPAAVAEQQAAGEAAPAEGTDQSAEEAAAAEANDVAPAEVAPEDESAVEPAQ